MSKTYRLGVLGIAHGHVNGIIDAFNALPNVEWVACADTAPATPADSAALRSRCRTSQGAGESEDPEGVRGLARDARQGDLRYPHLLP